MKIIQFILLIAVVMMTAFASGPVNAADVGATSSDPQMADKPSISPEIKEARPAIKEAGAENTCACDNRLPMTTGQVTREAQDPTNHFLKAKAIEPPKAADASGAKGSNGKAVH